MDVDGEYGFDVLDVVASAALGLAQVCVPLLVEEADVVVARGNVFVLVHEAHLGIQTRALVSVDTVLSATICGSCIEFLHCMKDATRGATCASDTSPDISMAVECDGKHGQGRKASCAIVSKPHNNK